MPQEEKLEMAIVEDDDGPPPGFQCIITRPQPPIVEEPEPDDDDDEEEEEEDGPPPGFSPKPTLSSDNPRSSEQDNIDDDGVGDDNRGGGDGDDTRGGGGSDDDDEDDDDDDDGPPPGWEFSSLVNALPKETSNNTGIKEESNEELDDGPPPGWELPCQMPPPCTPPLQLPSTVSSSTEMEIKQENTGNDDEGPPEKSQHIPMPGQLSPATSPLKQLPLSELPSDAGNKDGNNKHEKKSISGHKPASRPQQLRPNPHPLTPADISSPSEKAQLVCGTCRKLCVYPRGAKWVQCPGCQEVNFVLEAHEVGQVNCGGCSVLLMFPHGAPAVQCSSCRFVTEVGANNRRAPLSVQQAEGRARARAQAGRRHRRFNRAH